MTKNLVETIKKQDTVCKSIAFRVTEKEYKQIRAMCEMYAEGSLSAWVRHCVKHYKPAMLKRSRKKKTKKK